MRPIRLTQDEVITASQLAGVPPALALAVWQQESGSGSNAKTSSKGAVGGFQVTPDTFKRYMPAGSNINDPVDNMDAGLAVLSDGLRKSGGDWEGAAQFYYHGAVLPKGVEGPTSGAGTPTTRQYGQQVVAKAQQKAQELGLPEGEFKNPLYNQPPRNNQFLNDFGYPSDNQHFMDQPLEKPYNTDEEGNNEYPGDTEEEQGEPDYNMPQQLQAALGNHGYSTNQNMIPYDRFDPAINMIGSQNYDMDKYIRRLVDEEFNNG